MAKYFFKLFLIFMLMQSAILFATIRTKTDISTQWKFQKTTLTTPAFPAFNDSGWESIDIPHTWNALDAQDGGGNYARTTGWYRKTLLWDSVFEGKRLYLEVLAASLKSDCYVNGNLVGVNKDGYNAFRYDITDYLRKDTVNVIAIKVDNRVISDIIPLSGDFSVFGGIYRKVFLLVADELHVDLDDCGSNGLFLSTSEVSKTSAKLEIRARVVNKSNQPQTVSIEAVLKKPESFHGITEISKPRFNTTEMAPGGLVETLQESDVLIPAGGTYEFRKLITVANPRLWDGMTDPFRYQVDFNVSRNNQLVDQVTDYVGFRFFHADNTGFYLNGRLYPLRGVNRHQDWKDIGYAITENEHNADFEMIYEIGANAVRLAHYPQDPYFHELFDKYGIVVWVEIPFVDKFASDTTVFMETTRQQLRNMIRQRYNRPSILMWGLQNEVSTGSYDAQMSKIIPQLHTLAKLEDPTGRLTVQAQAGSDRSNWTTDLFGKNQYPGWYQSGTFGSYMDGYKNKHYVNGKYCPVGMSEYGAGGNPFQHEIIKLSGTTVPGAPYGHQNPWHPEEYQSLIHELAVKDIVARPWIWGTFVWNMFDFASDSRKEGEQPGINDKGLITHDRKIKKDAFYVYKVNWNSEPEVHIAGKRFTEHQTSVIPVKVYTNRSSVELYVNGVSQGVRQRTDANCGILEWTSVELTNKGLGEAGKNVIIAKSNDNLSDTVVWYRTLSTSTVLTSTVLVIDNTQKKISLTTTLQADQITNAIKAENNAAFILVAADELTPVSTGNVEPGMKLIVTAEDGKTKAVYEFVVQHIAYKKTVTASAVENNTNVASNAVDGNPATRWAAPNNATSAAPHWLEVDLGQDFVLNNVGIQWFNSATNSRAYKYNVLLKSNNQMSYSTIVNRSTNTQTDYVSDLVENAIGRYVKVLISGSTSSSAYAYPSISELQINGWMISSNVYDINFVDKTILIPVQNSNLDQDEFLGNLKFSGNESHRIESAAYYLVDGARLIITDSNGTETAFTIRFDASMSVDQLKTTSKYFTVSNEGNFVKIKLQNQNEASLKIWNTNGQLFLNEKISGTKTVSLPNDIYIVQINADNATKSAIKYCMK